MDTRLTTQQYRKLAEGLLQNAIEASQEQRQDLIEEALRYLQHAKIQEQRECEPDTDYETSDDDQDQYRQVRQLIKQALEIPTPEQFVQFLDFTTKFRRLSTWNAYMAHIQRPGARAIATEHEWRTAGRYVLPDAVPIIILWPFSPIRLVYELDDTGPPINNHNLCDFFAVKGEFKPAFLSRLTANLKKQRNFKITIENRRHGRDRAGSAAAQGNLWNLENEEIRKLAESNAVITNEISNRRMPAFRIVVNDRLAPGDRFVTLAHELAHIFCGHLGPCGSRGGNDDDEGGWPDRRGVGKPEKEIEAEAAAFQVASRAGLVARSAEYLAPYVRKADMSRLSPELIAVQLLASSVWQTFITELWYSKGP
jgi:hypothetical protein